MMRHGGRQGSLEQQTIHMQLSMAFGYKEYD